MRKAEQTDHLANRDRIEKTNQKKNIMGEINRLGGGDCEVNT